MKSGIRWSVVVVLVMAWFGVWDLQAQQPQAQQTAPTEYKTLPIADQYKLPDRATVTDRATFNEQRRQVMNRRRSMQTAVSELLKNKSSSVSANEMETFFNGYVIPLMTQIDEESLAELGKNREIFFRSYLGPASGQMRDRVLQLVFPAMQQIAEDNFHPACRVNATVFVSQLNQREGNRSARQLPVPYPAALNWMRKVVSEDTLPTYLKPAAIAGIERHAAVRGPQTSQPLSDQEAAQLASEMVTVMQLNPEEVAGIDPDLVYWMKRRAIRTLGYIGSSNSAGVLRDLIMDDKQDMKIRRDAIAAYGMLDFSQDKAEAQLSKVVPKIGELLAKAADEEAKYIDKKISDIRMTVKFLDGRDAAASDSGSRKKDSGLGMGGDVEGGSRGGGGGLAGQKDIPEVLPVYQRELVRRRIKNHAYITRVALAGNDRPVPRMPGLLDYAESNGDDERLIKELVKNIDSLMRASDVREPEPKDDDDDDDKKTRRDRDKDKGKEVEEEARTQSLADELKDALADSAVKIQRTLARFGPKETPAAEGNSSPAQGTNSSAGQ